MDSEKNATGIALKQPLRFALQLGQVIIATLFTLFIWHYTLLSLLEIQLSSNDQLKKLIEQRKKTTLQINERQQAIAHYEARLNFITNLHDQNLKAAQSVRELTKALLPTIQLHHIERQEKGLLVSGSAASTNALVQFMGNIAHSPAFFQPVLVESSPQQAERSQLDFQLKISLRT